MSKEDRRYNEDACKEAWKIYCSNFKEGEPTFSYGQAAKMAGITRCEMLNYGIDNRLIVPSDEEEAKKTLALIAAKA